MVLLLLLLLLVLLLRGDRGGGESFFVRFSWERAGLGCIGVLEYSGMVDRFVIVGFGMLLARRLRLCAAGCSFIRDISFESL